MKKYLILLILGLMVQSEVFGDVSIVTRSWCGGLLHRRFVAKARSSIMHTVTYPAGVNCIGQWMGYNPYSIWDINCDKANGGCARPQVASCINTGLVTDLIYSGCSFLPNGQFPYSNEAKVEYLVSGVNFTRNSYGRGSVGLSGTYELDPTIFTKLNGDGSSKAEISGDIQVTDANELSIKNLTGFLDITQNSDFFSNIKVIVFKENINISDVEAEKNELLVLNGTYPDVVYKSEITISNNKIYFDGIFSNQTGAPQISTYNIGGRKGVKLDNFSVSKLLNVNLRSDEKLTVITISDGGFDISSAIISFPKKTSGPVISGVLPNFESKIYPNPASQVVNFELPIVQEETKVQILCYDLTGRFVCELFSGILIEGISKTETLSTSSLPKGLNIVKIKIGDAISTKSLIIE